MRDETNSAEDVFSVDCLLDNMHNNGIVLLGCAEQAFFCPMASLAYPDTVNRAYERFLCIFLLAIAYPREQTWRTISSSGYSR